MQQPLGKDKQQRSSFKWDQQQIRKKVIKKISNGTNNKSEKQLQQISNGINNKSEKRIFKISQMGSTTNLKKGIKTNLKWDQ